MSSSTSHQSPITNHQSLSIRLLALVHVLILGVNHVAGLLLFLAPAARPRAGPRAGRRPATPTAPSGRACRLLCLVQLLGNLVHRPLHVLRSRTQPRHSDRTQSRTKTRHPHRSQRPRLPPAVSCTAPRQPCASPAPRSP